MKTTGLILSLFFHFTATAQERWELRGDHTLARTVTPGESFTDRFEMSGRHVSFVTTYGVKDGNLVSEKDIAFPMLRTVPNKTHDHAQIHFGSDTQPRITINGTPFQETLLTFFIRDALTTSSRHPGAAHLERTLFPSMNLRAVLERFSLFNASEEPLTVAIEADEKHVPCPTKGVCGSYEFRARTAPTGTFTLEPKQTLHFTTVYSARKTGEPWPVIDESAQRAYRAHLNHATETGLVFESPDPVLNRLFTRALFHTFENLYETKNGLIHSPGSLRYYAAIWANDQCEYVNPLFAYAGNQSAVESAMTCWRWYEPYMTGSFNPIPSSIIAEGTDIWNGAGDRGDAAMTAYGLGRFTLSLGDRQTAERLWPMLAWCLEYCRLKLTPEGVVASDCDELEHRFPAGKANLCTSTLYYDALLSAAALGRDLGLQTEHYRKQAHALRAAIDRHFGATVQGFDTYRYYEGNSVLRSWICIPLTAGLHDRAPATLDALFSHKLWSPDGLRTQAGDNTFWDRATLYGLRGAFAAGDTARALPLLQAYSRRRLLGDHVPYPVEAWPEGDQRQLAAESGLYCRVVTEGLFGYRPAGLKSFELRPRLPAEWNRMALRGLTASGGKKIDITVSRTGENIETLVEASGEAILRTTADTCTIQLDRQTAPPTRE